MNSRLEAIAISLQAIARRLEAITITMLSQFMVISWYGKPNHVRTKRKNKGDKRERKQTKQKEVLLLILLILLPHFMFQHGVTTTSRRPRIPWKEASSCTAKTCTCCPGRSTKMSLNILVFFFFMFVVRMLLVAMPEAPSSFLVTSKARNP